MTIIFLVLSVLLNVFFLFYIRWILKNMSEIAEDLATLWENLQGFLKHVSVIHESEMFYGDKSLQELIEHSKSLTEEIEGIRDFLPIDGDIEILEEPEQTDG